VVVPVHVVVAVNDHVKVNADPQSPGSRHERRAEFPNDFRARTLRYFDTTAKSATAVYVACMSTPRTKRPRSRAIVLAEHGEKPASLTPAQRTLLNEALRRGEDMRESVEVSVTTYGRWLLGEVFRDDTRAALEEDGENKVWRELVRRAGGPTLQIDRGLLSAALRVAALDKRLNDESWRGLAFGRKRLLLPLAEDARVREGARHVAKFNLSHVAIREYVSGVLGAEGHAPAVRLTMPRLVSRVQKLRKTLDSAAVLRKVFDLREEASVADRSRAAQELDQLRGVLGKLAKALRAKG
jgi:hypothetical protein